MVFSISNRFRDLLEPTCSNMVVNVEERKKMFCMLELQMMM